MDRTLFVAGASRDFVIQVQDTPCAASGEGIQGALHVSLFHLFGKTLCKCLVFLRMDDLGLDAFEYILLRSEGHRLHQRATGQDVSANALHIPLHCSYLMVFAVEDVAGRLFLSLQCIQDSSRQHMLAVGGLVPEQNSYRLLQKGVETGWVSSV